MKWKLLKTFTFAIVYMDQTLVCEPFVFVEMKAIEHFHVLLLSCVWIKPYWALIQMPWKLWLNRITLARALNFRCATEAIMKD